MNDGNKNTNQTWYTDFFACPDCQSDMHLSEHEIKCTSCAYAIQVSSPIEIKPIKPKPLAVELPRTKSPHPSNVLKEIDIGCPELSYDGPQAMRDSRALMSEMKNYLGSKGKVLDLGCGPRDQAVPVEYLGYQYVGIDYSNPKADILADAHAIPFSDQTFDCVLSYAVLEHLHNPFIALSEIERVLKPGGVYIGTVSQGEPFHDSYFHHTSWGLISVITSITGLKIQRIWEAGDTLGSLSRMGRYPKVIQSVLSLIDKIHRRFPFLAPRKMKWPELDKKLDTLHRAGSLCFVAEKPLG